MAAAGGSGPSYKAVCEKLGIPPSDDVPEDYILAGQMPDSMTSSHTVEKTYVIYGITPQDFVDSHGAVQFDMALLEEAFSKVCSDYKKPLSLNERSYSVEFASKIIYEVGPAARQVKKGKGDKTWKFVFPYGAELKKKVEMYTAFVSTFKSQETVPAIDQKNRRIVLTIKQASLIAVSILNNINTLTSGQSPPSYLLTPLAGAVFSKDDISKIARHFNDRADQVLAIINSSCQSGGQYIAASRVEVAAVAAIVSTRAMKDTNARRNIINKTVRQYVAQKKTFKKDVFELFSRFAQGGVPAGLGADDLIKEFDNTQELTRQQIATASGTSIVQSTVPTPGLDLGGGVSFVQGGSKAKSKR